MSNDIEKVRAIHRFTTAGNSDDATCDYCSVGILTFNNGPFVCPKGPRPTNKPTSYHNADADGWCQNPVCDWNVWGAKSEPNCPVDFGGWKAVAIQEQEWWLANKISHNVNMSPKDVNDSNEPTIELDSLRVAIRNAMQCDDREHLDSEDFDACYNCQIDKVLAVIAHEKLALLDSLIDLNDHEKSLPFGNSLWTKHEVIQAEADKIRKANHDQQ